MLAFVERALRILETLERQGLFKYGFCHEEPSGTKGQQLGLARIEPDRRASGHVNLNTGHMLTKIKFWLRLIEGTAAVSFIAGIIFATSLWINPNTYAEKPADVLAIQKNEQQYIGPTKCGGKIRKHRHNQETHSHP